MSVFEELKTRQAVRVGVAYAVISWLLAQGAEFAFENFGAPDWALKTFVVVLLLGLPLALLFAWAFELTRAGIKLEKNVDPKVVQWLGREVQGSNGSNDRQMFRAQRSADEALLSSGCRLAPPC